MYKHIQRSLGILVEEQNGVVRITDDTTHWFAYATDFRRQSQGWMEGAGLCKLQPGVPLYEAYEAFCVAVDGWQGGHLYDWAAAIFNHGHEVFYLDDNEVRWWVVMGHHFQLHIDRAPLGETVRSWATDGIWNPQAQTIDEATGDSVPFWPLERVLAAHLDNVPAVTIDEASMGSEWNPEVDDLWEFASILEELTGLRISVADTSDGGNADLISDTVWNRALKLYAQE